MEGHARGQRLLGGISHEDGAVVRVQHHQRVLQRMARRASALVGVQVADVPPNVVARHRLHGEAVAVDVAERRVDLGVLRPQVSINAIGERRNIVLVASFRLVVHRSLADGALICGLLRHRVLRAARQGGGGQRYRHDGNHHFAVLSESHVSPFPNLLLHTKNGSFSAPPSVSIGRAAPCQYLMARILS